VACRPIPRLPTSNDPSGRLVIIMRIRRLARVARLTTLAETRGVILATAHSATPRSGLERAGHNPAHLVRELRRPGNVHALLARGTRHPAVQELVNAGLAFLPGRYLPLGWAASWATCRVRRRQSDRAIPAPGPAAMGAKPPAKNVTPKVHSETTVDVADLRGRRSGTTGAAK
jgi:hypothetical protein